MSARRVLVVLAAWTLCGLHMRTAATGDGDGLGRHALATPGAETATRQLPALAGDPPVEGEDATPMAQHFFPSFFPSFGRPAGYSVPPPPPQQRSNSEPHASFQPIGFLHRAEPDADAAGNVLGSGNFGVIRGGTFFHDGDRGGGGGGGGGGFENYRTHAPYYRNGHGRPSYYKGGGGGGNPRPQQQRGNDFFANFRDFADINAPAKAAYSQLYVVYVNRNASAGDGRGPKNIGEQLALIDGAPDEGKGKASAAKRKLARTFKKRREPKKHVSPKELYEPLLALS